MAPSPTVPRGSRLPGDPVAPRLRPRARRSTGSRRSLVPKEQPEPVLATPIDRRTGRSLLLAPIVGRSSPKIGTGEADRRRDVELVGMALGVWVLVMLVVVQWA
jgi:hypothetical protein